MNPLSAISHSPVFDLIARPPVPVRFEGAGERGGPLKRPPWPTDQEGLRC